MARNFIVLCPRELDAPSMGPIDRHGDRLPEAAIVSTYEDAELLRDYMDRYCDNPNHVIIATYTPDGSYRA